MKECGADSEPFNSFATSLKNGVDYHTALADNPLIRSSVLRDFVTFNLDLAMNGEIYEVAAAFFYGKGRSYSRHV